MCLLLQPPTMVVDITQLWEILVSGWFSWNCLEGCRQGCHGTPSKDLGLTITIPTISPLGWRGYTEPLTVVGPSHSLIWCSALPLWLYICIQWVQNKWGKNAFKISLLWGRSWELVLSSLFSEKKNIAMVASQSHQGISFFWIKAVFCHGTCVLRE